VGDVDVTSTVCPIRQLVKRTIFLQADVTSIDLQGKRVSVLHCSGAETDNLHYDYLLIALGSQTNYFNLPGLEERALTMKTLGDAINLRNRLIASLEEAEFDACTGRKPLTTYVVAGAGFAGVETVAGINDFLREAVRYYPHLTNDIIEVMLVDFISTPLPELGEELGSYAADKLKERGVQLRMNTKVTGMTDKGIQLGDSLIPAVLVIWTAGIAPHVVTVGLPCKHESNKIVANEYLEVPEFPGVWALGDCTYIVDPHTGKPYPPTAQHASRQGTIAGYNIAAAVRGTAKKPFLYKSMGSLAAIGRHCGVAKVMGFKFSGLLAWLMWRTIYLAKLPGIGRKMKVAANWTLDMFFKKDFVQFMTLASPLPQHDSPSPPDVRPSEATRQQHASGSNV
jgi:NADH:ubiquinone reductase (H+-translocating)